MTTIDQLLGDVGRLLGVDQLALDSDRSAALEVDDVVVNFEAEDEGRTLVLFADVGAPPRKGEVGPEYYETLLRANFFQLGTGGSTLGMDRDAGMIALVRRLSTAALDANALFAEVEQFVDFAEAWTRRLAELAAQGLENSQDGAAEPGMLRI